MKKNKIRFGYYCPYCGNEVPASVVYSKNHEVMKCEYCKHIFPKYEIVKEKK